MQSRNEALDAAIKVIEDAMKKKYYHKCPICGAPEIESQSPRTYYYCGSSYDGENFTTTRQFLKSIKRRML
jgi:ssDNA-binding Zn-finger/Zn-ribbon topoisomerase 1